MLAGLLLVATLMPNVRWSPHGLPPLGRRSGRDHQGRVGPHHHGGACDPNLVRRSHWGLQALRVPRLLVIVASLFRWAETLTDELARMRRRALAARNYQPRWLGDAPALGHLLGSLFLRSYARSERVHRAMLSRGWEGATPAVAPDRTGTRFRVRDAVFLTAMACIPDYWPCSVRSPSYDCAPPERIRPLQDPGRVRRDRSRFRSAAIPALRSRVTLHLSRRHRSAHRCRSHDAARGILALIGPNGAGKSTLALHIPGLIEGGRRDWSTEPLSALELCVRCAAASVSCSRSGGPAVHAPPWSRMWLSGPLNQRLTPEEVEKRVTEALRAVGLEELSHRPQSPFLRAEETSRTGHGVGHEARSCWCSTSHRATSTPPPGGRWRSCWYQSTPRVWWSPTTCLTRYRPAGVWPS